MKPPLAPQGNQQQAAGASAKAASDPAASPDGGPMDMKGWVCTCVLATESRESNVSCENMASPILSTPNLPHTAGYMLFQHIICARARALCAVRGGF